MNNNPVCLGSSPIPAPTTSPHCAIPVGLNLSAILSSCCHGAPIATYGDFQLNSTTCFQYCNITAADYANNTVMNCLTSAPGMVDIIVACGDGKGLSTSSAPTHGTSTLVWAIMGMVIAGAVIGADVAL